MRLLGLLVVALAVAGLAPAAAQASCIPILEWRGSAYYGGFDPRRFEIGGRVGTALEPDCADTGEEPGPPTPVSVYRVKGIRPAIALAAREYGDVYQAEGYVIESVRHPLHRALFRRGQPNETRGWSCGRSFLRRGRVVSAPPSIVSVDLDRLRGKPQFAIDVYTRFSGLHRFGVPYLGLGTHVTLRAIRCTASRGRSKLVARAFWPAP